MTSPSHGLSIDHFERAVPLARDHMPRDFHVSLDSYLGRAGLGAGHSQGEQRIPDSFGPPQSMRGFESTYRNIIDYIVRITYKIWEDREVAYIADTYAENSRVYDDYGLQLGNRKIISDTHHTTAAFSDIQLIADEVIWAGNDEVGYHTSHRTLIRGTNDGDSKYGPATGKRVDVMVIANCVALDNRIFLEHVLYNNSSLVCQLGLDLNTVARSMIAEPPKGWPRNESDWQGLRASHSPMPALSVQTPVSGFDPDAFERELFDAVWNRQDRAIVAASYAQDFVFEGATGRKFVGMPDYQDLASSLFKAFPDLILQVDEVYWMGNEQDGFLTSIRWSAIARHDGEGSYGPPTGATVQIWGITQHRIINSKITHEWMLFNELELIMQLNAARSN